MSTDRRTKLFSAGPDLDDLVADVSPNPDPDGVAHPITCTCGREHWTAHEAANCYSSHDAEGGRP